MEIFLEISLIIALTTIIAIVMRLLKQPLIIGYIITGIVAGPLLLNIVGATDVISVFSQIGISLLLFIVGLNLNPKVIKETGKISFITGIGQVLFTSIIGFFICRYAFGFSNITSAYIAVALTFSSTIIIMKLLSDKGDLETLYGRISIGFLIVQDFIAIFILMLITALPSEISLNGFIAGTVLKGVGLLISLFLIGYFILPSFTKMIARSQELLLLFSIAWVLVLSSLFHYLGFSIEIGSLLAGVTLSLSPYRYEISSRMRPLRDFFLILFFILLGVQMSFSNISQYILPIILLSLFVLIGNPLIVMILMGLLKYTKRNGFLAGLTVAQISEFSLILVALGIKVGHLTNETLSFVTAVGLITIAGSTYLIIYANKIYPYLSKYLNIFERKGIKVDEHKYHEYNDYKIILFGYNRIGHDLLESFKKLKKKFLVVDYNPETIISLAKQKIDCRYGDASDSELLSELNFSKAKMIYSTIPDFDTNLLLVTRVKELNKKAIIVVVSHQIDEAIELYDKGATYVIMPHFLGGKHASTLIENYKFNLKKFVKEGVMHIKHLKNRRKIGHEHPRHERG